MFYSTLRVVVVVVLSGFVPVFAIPAHAQCKRVEFASFVTFDANALRDLGRIGIDRAKIFEAIKEVSIPETSGCWSGATGNFDAQIVSVGTLQWNYGQNSLQPLIRRYKQSFRSDSVFQAHIAQIMPRHGRLIFSSGCTRAPITTECRESILALQENGRLTSSLKTEFDALFESNGMIQIQTDRFVALLQSVRDDLKRVFRNQAPTLRQIKWAIDTKVQQGGFPGDDDIDRMRANWKGLTPEAKKSALLALVDWYSGLSASADQGGIRLDRRCNLQHWREKINDGGVQDDQADLLNLSFLKSRTASGMSGHWQALTFQRRAKIILALGSVAGDRVGIPSNSQCLSSTPSGSADGERRGGSSTTGHPQLDPAIKAILFYVIGDWG